MTYPQGPGEPMQYLDSPPPEVALACYNAGHSLYFNPSADFQQRWISALTQDLGHSFGATIDGGIGGDIELFAVSGRHKTPWHFDAQVFYQRHWWETIRLCILLR